ncbi:DUF1700 domain-containing protein [Blautia sp. HCP3S3_G3]|uniref:DUF1700 domain-containing protein n=1 Tax=Blautia sp. HCP3S3_G3 TaxID=3438913 RepID=UPI003F8A3154
MNRTEFLEILREQLSGEMPEGSVAAHIRYYHDYFEEQMKKGRSESEILQELGDPRLIARTLLDTDPQSDQAVYGSGRYESSDKRKQGSENGSGYDRMNQEQVKHRTYRLDLTTWYGKAIVIAAAALIIAGLLVVIGTVLPVIVIVCLVLYLISWIRKR